MAGAAVAPFLVRLIGRAAPTRASLLLALGVCLGRLSDAALRREIGAAMAATLTGDPHPWPRMAAALAIATHPDLAPLVERARAELEAVVADHAAALEADADLDVELAEVARYLPFTSTVVAELVQSTRAWRGGAA